MATAFRRPTAADTKTTKITKFTKSFWLFYLVVFVIFVIFVSQPWAVSSQASAVSPQAATGRTMALTFDDLPKSSGVEDIEGSRRTTESILRVLKAHKAPAIGFVNEGKLYRGATMVPDRAGLLKSWVDARIPLANHTYSHIDINNVPLEKYEDDVVRGERTYTRLQRGTGMTERWFRHPFTHTGPTAE